MTTETAKLGDLISPARPIRAGTNKYPILSMTMKEGLVDQGKKFKKRVASKDTSNYKVIQRGQLVVGFPIDEGVLSIQNIHDEAIVSPAYGVWNIEDEKVVRPEFLERYLRSPRAISYYKSKLRSTTARRRSLTNDAFLNLRVPLIPSDSQRRAAIVFDKTEEIQLLRRKAIAHLDDLAQSVFYETFGDPNTNPHGWPIGTIRDLTAEAKYGTSKKANTERKGIPILRMGNITYSGALDLVDLKFVELDEKELSKYTARKGDLLFNRTNSKDLVGKTCVYNLEQTVAIAGYLVRIRTNEKADPHYVSGYLNSRHGKSTLRNMCKNIVGMANINAQDLQNIQIAIPPIDLQRSYRVSVESISQQKTQQQHHLDVLDKLLVSVEQRAFSGEL